MRKLSVYALLCILVVNAAAEIYFSEEFDSDWEKRWVLSKSKGADAGKFATSAGKYYEDSGDKGLKTTEDYRFYQISAKLDKEFDNKGKDLFFQFTVKHEQNIDCGGGYFKLLPAPLDQTSFSGESPYHVMFGPDFCGGTRKCHVIFTHNGKNFLIKKNINAPQDTFTHLYQLRLHPDQSFEVYIDGEEKLTGNLLDEDLFDFLPPKRIPDPNVHKPKDWVDEKEILDPEAKKPAGWDDIPEYITDSEAKQPEDWDSELDGDWEAPQIPNPDYKGPWVHPKIPNPAYKGPWEAPIIDNPEYKEDHSIYHFVSNYVGLEIWQVKSGSIFDAILVTDDSKVAQKWSDKVLKEIKEEKARFDKEEEERKAREEEERKQRDDELDEEEGEDDEEKDDDHHHDEL